MADLLRARKTPKKGKPVEKTADVLAEFARQDWINWHYRDTGDQSWRGKTRRGRAVKDE